MLTFFSSTINNNIFLALLFENIHILLKLCLKLCMVFQKFFFQEKINFIDSY